ncbi:Uncharacterised protein [Candidatus Burarchaeum australiense]|nr:Uncharacterised protein [Candidatus Burarchaeum australiense]
MMASCTIGLTGLATWSAIIGLSAFLAILTVSLLYMLGKLFRVPTITAWAKIEIYEAAATVMFVAGAAFIIGIACAVDLSFFYYYLHPALGPAPMLPPGFTGAGDFFQASTTYLADLQHLTYANYYLPVQTVLQHWEVQASVSKFSCLTSICLILPQGWSIDPGTGYYSKMGAGYFILNSLMVAMLSISSLLFMLQYASSGALLLLFPLGAIFRSIPYMRGFGGALMALALVLYLGLPLLLFLNALIAYGPLVNAPLTLPPKCLATGEGACIGPMALMAATAGFVTVFLPALDFILLAAFGRELAGLFGSELDLMRLSQLV